MCYWYYRPVCWGDRKGTSWDSLLQEITRSNSAEHEMWWRLGPGLDLLPRCVVKTCTARKGNAGGWPCNEQSAFNRSHLVAEITSYMLRDGTEGDVEWGGENMYIHEQRAHVCGGGQKCKTKRSNQQGWLCLELHAKPLWRFTLPVASTAALVGLPTC